MKTPKRKYSFPIDSDNYPGMRNAFEGEDVPSAHARQCERWKRKNREAQYKRTIANLHKKLDDIDTCRIICRKHLGAIKDFFLTVSRAATTEDAKVYWLKKTGEINLILGVTVSDAELDAQFRGEPTPPCTMEYTDEERELLRKIREEEKAKEQEANES